MQHSEVEEAQPDEHGWWPLFRYVGTDRDTFPMWRRAYYLSDEVSGRVSRSWGPATNSIQAAFHFPGGVLQDTLSIPMTPSFARPGAGWTWAPLREADPRWTDFTPEVARRYEEMRSSPNLSMANARLFAVNLAQPYPQLFPGSDMPTLDPNTKYTMQMVLDDRASLKDWTYYDASKHPLYGPPEFMLVIRQVTHVRVVETDSNVLVPKEVWSPMLPTPHYVATRGRYQEFVDGAPMQIGPNDSEQLAANGFNRRGEPMATWMLNGGFLNMGNTVIRRRSDHPEQYLTNPMSLQLRLYFPECVADGSARTDPYTLAQERGEVPRYRMSMAQAVRAAMCAKRWNKGFIDREWGLQGRQKEAGKRAIAELQRGDSSSSSDSEGYVSLRPPGAGTRSAPLPSLAALKL